MIELKNKYPFLIIAIAALFFIPYLGHVHLFDWDEINFAESSREMIVSGDYSRVMVGFKPFWEKPPLFFWLQAGSMQIFGINEFAARLPNAIFGIITLLTLFYLGRKERNEQFALVWVLAYFGSLLPHMYFKSGIIDPVFNYFIFTGVYFLYKTLHYSHNRTRHAVFSAALIGLAILTKGPVGLLIPLLTFIAILAIYKFKVWPRIKDVLAFTLVVILVSSAWYGMELFKNGPWFLIEFINYQIELFRTPVADHQQPFYYHFVVVLLGCFPMSVLAFGSFSKRLIHGRLSTWMMTLFWVVMILFTLVTTKIVHYSSLSYLPLSFLAATYVTHVIELKIPVKRAIIWSYGIIGILFGSLLSLVPLLVHFKDSLIPFIKDPFAVAGLNKAVEWGGYEFVFGVIYILAVVISLYLLKTRSVLRSIGVMSAGTAITLFFYMIFVLPKIEAHSQGTLINFLQEQKGKNVYVMTYGFHSYAPYFYFEQPNDHINERADKGLLLSGDVDKPVYIITKITEHRLEGRDGLFLLKEDGGFRFYYREAVR